MKELFDYHKKEFDTMPEAAATAPGRFHLIGEHSWFFKDKTLSMAVDMPVYVSVSKRKDSSLKFYFAEIDDTKRANLTSLK